MYSSNRNEENSFTGHILSGSNYRLWKFQITAYMKARSLTNNIDGKEPDENAIQAEKEKYEQNEGKAMNAIIQSLDHERANFVLTCKTAKEMMDKIKSIYEKNSEIRVMTLYEEYFSLKMKDDESVAGYIAKVNQLACEIEQQGEKLSDKLKMVRIISSLPVRFNNYKTVWYNTKETRTIDTLMSSLQLEEDNLNQINCEHGSSLDVAFSVKSKRKDLKKKTNINEIKKKSKCNSCGQVGHWAKDKTCPKYKSSSYEKAKGNCKSDKGSSECAWGSVVCSNKEEESNCWFADSGASKHMTFHREWFSEMTKYTGIKTVKVANDCQLKIYGIGTVLIDSRVNNQWKPRRLENVLFVPDLKENLFSTAVLTDKGIKIVIEKDGCEMIDSANNVVAVGKRCEMNQLKMDFRLRISEYANMAAVPLEHWHRRLGHINVDSIKKMFKDGSVTGVNLSDNESFFCEDCQYGKMTRSTHKSSIKRASVQGEYMHVDLCGPMEEIGVGGIRYFMLIKDEATTFRHTYLLKSKEEVFECLSSFISLIHNNNGIRVKKFRFDNGTEFVNQKVKKLMSKKGIQIEYITAYTPEQNGRIERDNRTVQECARTMLIASGLPKMLWPEAVRTATYLLNRTTNSKCTGSTPYEKWFNRKPYLGHIKIFGTECFVQIPKQTGRKKWDPKAKKVFLVGFEPSIKNFRLYDPVGKNVFLSCDVRFNEMKPNINVIQDITESDNKIVNKNDSQSAEIIEEENMLSNKESANENATSADESNENDSVNNKFQRRNERYCIRPVIKRPERLIESSYSAFVIEPKTYEEAIESNEVQQWKCAMDDEYNSLIKNHTWDLVEPPENQKVIDNRWVFKVKPNTDNTIERFKARLVVRGFTQQYGVDYEETFSPVVKYTSIRTILSLAAMNKMQLKHFDIKTAFLYGELKETVYMKQPVGYEDTSGRVCKLVKSLYGLKQASRCWNQKFTSFIRRFDFRVSDFDSCVFMRSSKDKITIIAIYVDDGMIATNSADEIDLIISYLQEQFEIKVFDAKCFLGLEIERLEDGSIHVHQRGYAERVLQRFNMTECKTVSTPMDNNQNLGDFVNDDHEAAYPYREAVGSLMYLSIGTRPDISYAIGVVSRYLERPSLAHVNAVKRIFKYIKGTVGTGILYKSQNKFDFVGYSDADYAGDSETRRSTSGYVFHIGSGAISWASTRQQSVSTSSTESEYMAACQAIKELTWLKGLISELSFVANISATFYMDNQSAIRLVKNPVFHKRTKHIDVQYHFIREKFEQNHFNLEYVNTDEQIADLLTKALNRNRHKYLSDLIGLTFELNK